MHAYNRSIWETKAGNGVLEARLDCFKGENVKLESRDKVNHEPQDLTLGKLGTCLCAWIYCKGICFSTSALQQVFRTFDGLKQKGASQCQTATHS